MTMPGQCIRNCLEQHFGERELPAKIRATVREGSIKLDELNPLLAAKYGEILEAAAAEWPKQGSALVGVCAPGLAADHCILIQNGEIVCDTFQGDSQHPGAENWQIKKVWKRSPPRDAPSKGRRSNDSTGGIRSRGMRRRPLPAPGVA